MKKGNFSKYGNHSLNASRNIINVDWDTRNRVLLPAIHFHRIRTAAFPFTINLFLSPLSLHQGRQRKEITSIIFLLLTRSLSLSRYFFPSVLHANSPTEKSNASPMRVGTVKREKESLFLWRESMRVWWGKTKSNFQSFRLCRSNNTSSCSSSSLSNPLKVRTVGYFPATFFQPGFERAREKGQSNCHERRAGQVGRVGTISFCA